MIYLSLHCHHQNDSCIKTGSDESHFNVSVGSGEQSHKTVSTNHNLFEDKGEPKRYRTEVLPLTNLTPYRWAKPAHTRDRKWKTAFKASRQSQFRDDRGVYIMTMTCCGVVKTFEAESRGCGFRSRFSHAVLRMREGEKTQHPVYLAGMCTLKISLQRRRVVPANFSNVGLHGRG